MSTPAPTEAPPAKPARFVRWHRRVLAFCLIIFAFELGVFLLVYPWLRNWDMSWIPVHAPKLAEIWVSRYFRGAISGLGLLNIYISFAELLKQLRSLFSPSR